MSKTKGANAPESNKPQPSNPPPFDFTAATEAELQAYVESQPESPAVRWVDADKGLKLKWCQEHCDKYLKDPINSKDAREKERAAYDLMHLTDQYAMVIVGDKSRVIDLDEKESLRLLPKSTFSDKYLNRRFRVYNSEGVPTQQEYSLSDLWEIFPKRRTFHRVVFKPPVGGDPPFMGLADYNAFIGFKTKPAKTGHGYPKFRHHLFDVVCQGDEERFNFVMSWFADVLQNPGRKTGSAIILKGLEGSGKSFVGDEFVKIVGPRHAFTLSSEEQVTGRFNAHLALSLFCQMEEALLVMSRLVV